ncbi:MAG TPA: AbrB/MazE/SpoVT family DNA-binding domain-containing protein [Terriglobales bacterium]|jgi:AbrB family looped-hinge helix DNA binding protein
MSDVIKTKINPNGRVVIPLSVRKALGVKPGDEVMMRMVEGELRIYTTDGALERLRRELRELTAPEAGATPAENKTAPAGSTPAASPSPSLVEDLVRTRRGGERTSWRA